MKLHVRQSKYDPLVVDDVTLVGRNDDYAFVRLLDGCETTISTRHLHKSSCCLMKYYGGDIIDQEVT